MTDNFQNQLIKKSSRGRTPEGEPNPIDVHVGSRIRLRRTLLGLSQEKLATMLGLTFQQVQKYERGANRISASRLWDISKILGVEIAFFYDDMDKKTAEQSPRMFSMPDGSPDIIEDTEPANTNDPMTKQQTINLVKAYYKINNPAVAKQIYDLIVNLSKSS